MHPFCDVRPVINSYINDMWQMELDKYENKLYETNPSVRFFFPNFKSRLFLQGVFYGYLLKGEEPPSCQIKMTKLYCF